MLSESQRASALDQKLMATTARGGHVDSRTPTSATMAIWAPANHVLHLVITALL
jgi:hypothetical protein